MNKSRNQIQKRIVKLLGKLDLPYFDKDETDTSDKDTVFIIVGLNCCLPYVSLQHIMSMCEFYDLSCSFSKGTFEICYVCYHRNTSEKAKLRKLFTQSQSKE